MTHYPHLTAQTARRLLLASLLGLSLGVSAQATEPEKYPTIDLNSEAQTLAENDTSNAIMAIEANDKDVARVATKIKESLSWAFAEGKSYGNRVSIKSGNSNSYPVYDKNDQRIVGWRMHSELVLESKDSTAIAELIGVLQQRMLLTSLNFSPSKANQKKAEDEAIADALISFQGRAAAIAKQLNSRYEIVNLGINQNGSPPPRPQMMMMRAKAVSYDAAPMPSESGSSEINVRIDGKIRLLPK